MAVKLQVTLEELAATTDDWKNNQVQETYIMVSCFALMVGCVAPNAQVTLITLVTIFLVTINVTVSTSKQRVTPI